jgi:acyl-CoA thioester hydrolase
MQHYLQSRYIIRFSDCDPFRHLNNARYIDYFLNAREDHLKEHYQFDLAEMASRGQAWVVKDHQISYLRPALYNETVLIGTALLEISIDQLLVEMIMLDEKGRQLKSIMHTRFVPINPFNGKKEVHASEFMDFISDKIHVIPGGLTSQNERLEYWQTELKSRTEFQKS